MNKELENLEKEATGLVAKLQDMKTEIHKVVVGQEEVMDQLIIGMLAGGHILIEGLPGLAKTLMIKTLATAVKDNQMSSDTTEDQAGSDWIMADKLSDYRIQC